MPSASRESVALAIKGKATVGQDPIASEFPVGTRSMVSRCWEGARSLAWPFDQCTMKPSGGGGGSGHGLNVIRFLNEKLE